MLKEKLFEIIINLEFDNNKVVFIDGDTEVYVFRPSILSKRFESYDINRNFQIWIKEGERRFKPNHLRLMIDLNLRVRSRPDLKKDLLIAFDNIFYGSDPEKELEKLSKEKFEHHLNKLIVTGYLAQLFHIEQEYGYHKESKFEPSNLFLQGWVRQFLDGPKEIDNLCMSVCNGQPPASKYVNLENKKSKKYRAERKALWYLEE